MPIASLLIDSDVKYRDDGFKAGLGRLGYFVSDRASAAPSQEDVLVIWNRFRHQKEALAYDRAGAPVIVAENGYIGKAKDGRQLYALARGQHNGAGRWHVGAENRWGELRISCGEWRRKGRHILVLPQRGIGPPGVAMPKSWPDQVSSRLKRVTDRPVRVRLHPGQDRPSLTPDLEGCWAAVTWGSGAGIKAIIAGTPVFHDMEGWIAAPAARFGLETIEDPFLGDRQPMLHRLSYAQWSIEEISTGEPLKRLLELT